VRYCRRAVAFTSAVVVRSAIFKRLGSFLLFDSFLLNIVCRWRDNVSS
jgi:hypothetical protein